MAEWRVQGNSGNVSLANAISSAMGYWFENDFTIPSVSIKGKGGVSMWYGRLLGYQLVLQRRDRSLIRPHITS